MKRRGLLLDKYYEYETLQGDAFDMIALDFYNDEVYAPLIMEANPQFKDILVFDSGVKLKIPVIESEISEMLPPWKR